ncbi:MAG: sigma-54-dependent Fis family transcriptional regulator [Acidobacteria bacterium]|nr:sigma-54-dependent Fis family transcriptional regulator [Acidobacteriota bacterium]
MSRSLARVLVVDDDPAIREVLEIRLRGWGFDVLLADSGTAGVALAERADPDAVLSDVVMPEASGIDLLRSLKAGNTDRPVILMTAYGSIDKAVEAMKEGAEDFLTKPLDYAKLEATLISVLEGVDQRAATRRLSRALERGGGLGQLVGLSKPMRRVYQLIRTLAASDASAIVTGESGTGKELVARTLHDLSSRAGEAFIAVNSAAIPDGLLESEVFGHEKGAFTGAVNARPGCFELAHRGTLFLDEIGEMPVALQPKLLRLLEDGRVRRLGGRKEVGFDVRVLAATNRNPETAVAEGKLRSDLFYRLNVFTVALPPLREREGDLPLLAQHFVQRFNAKHDIHLEGIDPEALELLRSYPWPGNVRELRNVVERGAILARKGWLGVVHLPPYVRRPSTQARTRIVLPPGVTAQDAERILILETLEQVGQNKAEAARQLGLDVKTIRNKLRAYERRPEA